ncbi:MAG: lipase family protein [Planctomycetaceae bacterium]
MLPPLNPKVSKDYHNARYLATACDLAYLPADTGCQKFQAELGLRAELISVDNTQVYVGQNETSVVVAFRGSEMPGSIDGFKDWLLTNARNFLVLPEGQIGTDFAAAGVGARFHRGFMAALSEVWEPLYQAVDAAILERERPLWVTGHSLGGAVALLSAWRFERQFLKVHQVYTFGAPMIGNPAAAEAFQKQFPGRIFRFVDSGDPVPLLPTISLTSNEYKHCLQEVVLGATGVGDAIQEAAGQAIGRVLDATFIDEIWGKLNQRVDSHLMSNYLHRIGERIA